MPRGIAAPSVFLCVIAGVFILPSGLSSGIIQGTFPISERTRQAEEDFYMGKRIVLAEKREVSG
ncbi:hypothetical protein HMPREF9413_4021 [Paenibacillus sp. HGF7]|nr:hypothetical protein HMPREF9413_4021 [Paenibacillus sp. HGF7]EPD82802.1 hypothetical protein HMPREF1207_03594 [Paenibacillus sp. HGH0039]